MTRKRRDENISAVRFCLNWFYQIFVSFLCLSITACQNHQILPPNTLRISFASDPTTIDPKRSGDFISSTLICLLFEGLMRCESGSEIKLGVAQKIDISPDGKTYRFILRKTFWTDGHPVTAYDFEHSWKTILKPGFPSLCAYLLYPIKNAEKYAKGDCKEEDIGIHSIDEQTLLVELEHPTPYFLSLTAFPLYMPTPSHLKDSSSWEDPHCSNVICNGPFFLHHMDLGSEILIKKNPLFWNQSKISLQEIHISIINRDLTALQLFDKGELDIIGGPLTPLSSETLSYLKNEGPLQYLPMSASTFCTLNTKSYPFHNKNIRAAFQKAAQDHPYLVKEIEQNGHIPARTILPPSLCILDTKDARIEPAAQKLLKAGCEEMGILPESLKELTLYYKSNPTEKKIAQTLQKIWLEVLEIPIQIEQIEAKCLISKLYAKDYEMAITSWIAQFHDPINILERFKDENTSKNYPGWSSTKYQAILNQSVAITDEVKRKKLLSQAETILQEENILIPLYHWKSPILLHPRIQGLVSTDSGGLLIEKCYIEPTNKNIQP